MVEFNPLSRQPSNLDFASPSQFRFQLLKLPNVEYFVTSVNLPGISFSGDASMNTPFTSIHFMGDTLDFADLELTFLVNEDLSNYREIHDWMVGIGFPKDRSQFTAAVDQDASLIPPSGDSNTTSSGGTRTAVNPISLQSDATLTLLTNKNNPTIRVNFKNCYPTSLGGLTYNTQTTDSEQLTTTTTLKYDYYEFEVL